MPDIDRDALNRALAEKLGDVHGYDHWALPDGVHRTPKEFCYSLDAAVTAIQALGLQWQKTGDKTVAVWRYGEYAEFQPADGATLAALAAALVQATLRVLGEEETGDLG
jgi:hypothetical protein